MDGKMMTPIRRRVLLTAAGPVALVVTLAVLLRGRHEDVPQGQPRDLIATPKVTRGPLFDPRKPPSRSWTDPEGTAPPPTWYCEYACRTLDGRKSSYLIYLPPGYADPANSGRRYPVIYWLHGYGAEPQDGVPGFVENLDLAVRSGAAPPVIAVLPNGLVDSWYCDAADGSQPMESVIVNDLIPHVDATYRTVADRRGRAIEGFSMGGWGAARLAFKYPDRFACVTIISSPFYEPDDFARSLPEAYQRVFGSNAELFRAAEPVRLADRGGANLGSRLTIRVWVGTEDGNLETDRWFHRRLQSLAIPHEYVEVPGAEHRSSMFYKSLGDRAFTVYKNVFRGDAAIR